MDCKGFIKLNGTPEEEPSTSWTTTSEQQKLVCKEPSQQKTMTLKSLTRLHLETVVT